ncbi:asparagine synthase (glutamine-hydrolyzing) [Streptomyces armeniacus]|uniref:asparagine synthase (glutamine-hydrolyzing) n=1 Tax=Streptomyces armeniacus TaxID=83291 RepID=A0A345XLN0_9ACTN|nr:asparagine synthase (glutamine-hydrolyzing) [Streptomyces armeniacus]AXK32546.1 asparagine synthase (glutamine-hydrolyzing) [Streptomyces armeniacus]
MAGITGWVDHGGELQRDAALVRRMTGALAARGPDGEALWAGQRAVLGHRRLAAEGQGLRRCATGAPGAAAVLVFDGELYDRAALRDAVIARGRRPDGDGDADLVLAAYLAWGPACVRELSGVFAFGLWDERTDELLLARDPVGIKPLYYYPTPRGVLFASEPKALLAHPAVDVTVDADGLREVLSFAGTPGHAVFRGMRKLLPGELLRVGREGRTADRYWRLEGRPHTDDLETTVERVRELLSASVARRLAVGGPEVSIMLSGGLDSSLITALALRETERRGGGRVQTLSVDFKEHSANARRSGTDDSTFAIELARELGTEHQDVQLDRAELLGGTARAAALQAYPDLPCPVGEMTTALHVFFRSVASATPVTVMGEWADTLFGAFLRLEDPEVVARRTLPWVASAQLHVRSGGVGSGLFAPDLLGLLDLPAYCEARFEEEVADMPVPPDGEGPPESARDRRMREISYLYLRGWMEMGLAQDDGLTSSHGLRFRAPFADPELMQYAYGIPWSMKNFDGRSKSLLREVASGLVPARILERPKNPFPSTPDTAHARALRDELTALLDDPAAPVLPLVDVQAAREAVADVEKLATGWQSRADVEMILQTDTWLRLYRPRLAL